MLFLAQYSFTLIQCRIVALNALHFISYFSSFQFISFHIPDINECQGWGQGHRCPVGTVCQNTEGSFHCVCREGSGIRCEGSCQGDGTLYENGAVWRPRHDRCSVCTCLVMARVYLSIYHQLQGKRVYLPVICIYS